MSRAEVEAEVSKQALASVDTKGNDVTMKSTCAKQEENVYRCAIRATVRSKEDPTVKPVTTDAANVTATVDGDTVVVDGL